MAENIIPLVFPYQQAGLQDKPYLAGAAITRTEGIDLYTTPGVLRTGKSTTNISTTLSNALGVAASSVSCIVPVSTTVVYIFAGTGIYKYNPSADSVSTLGTAASSTVVNAKYFNGLVYFCGNTAIGTVNPSTDAVTNGVYAMSNGNTTYHPMEELDGVLYIGDGKYVATIDTTPTFTANALDVRPDYIVTALDVIDHDLLIGTKSTIVGVAAAVYRWNTWSVSFSSDTYVQEEIVVNFFKVDGNVYLLAYSSYGQPAIYTYGAVISKYVKLSFRGDFDETTSYFLYPNAKTYYQGRVFFGVSMTALGGIQPGIYSFGSLFPGSNPVIANEYNCSANITGFGGQHVLLFRALATTATTMLIGWEDQTGGATYQFGVDKIGTGLQIASKIYTGILAPGRGLKKDFGVEIFYARHGSGATMSLAYENPIAGTLTAAIVKDSDRYKYYTEQYIAGVNEMFMTVTIASPSSADYLDVTGINISF